MMKFSPQPLCGSNLFKYSLLSFMILNAHAAYADEATLQNLVKTPSQAEQVTVPFFGGVLKSMLTLNEAIIDVKEG